MNVLLIRTCNVVKMYCFFLVANVYESGQNGRPANRKFVQTNGHLSQTLLVDRPLFCALHNLHNSLYMCSHCFPILPLYWSRGALMILIGHIFLVFRIT